VGENVVFSIGDIVFPTLVGQEVISLLDVFSQAHQLVMSLLLQTLDEDDISGNGISIQAHN
jgi:hypothetical protein